MKDMKCEAETGSCEIIDSNKEVLEEYSDTGLELLYFTDPMCSACYIFEKDFTKFIKKHRKDFNLSMYMGGLVPNKDSFNDPANGISSPNDVAKHWKEMGNQFGIDINTDMWTNDPMESSYPPSIAIKAAEIQSKRKAEELAALLKIALFERGENIEREDILIKYATEIGLNIDLFNSSRTGKAQEKFYDDLKYGQSLGVAGFPTLIFIKGDKGTKLTGIRSFDELERFYEEAKNTL